MAHPSIYAIYTVIIAVTIGIPECVANYVDVVIFANKSYLHRAKIDGTDHHIIPLQNVSQAKFVEFDPVKNQMYWSDIKSGLIWRCGLCGEDQQIVLNTNASRHTKFISLAINSRDRTIYWTNNGRDTVEMANLDGTGHNIIARYGIGAAKDVVLDIDNRYVYWLDGGIRPKIERSRLDGNERKTVINLAEQYPSAMTIDSSTQKIYWNDINNETLMSANADGSDVRRISVSSTPKVPNMIGMSILGDYIYWERFFNGKVERLSKSKGGAIETVISGQKDIQDVIAIRINETLIQCPPGRPTDLILNNITKSTVTIEWKPGYNWGISQHFAIYKNDSTQWVKVATIQDTGKSYYTYKISNLTQKETYKIRVRACNEKYGCSMEAASFRTKGPPDRPKDLNISNITNSTVIIGWRPGYNWGIPQHFVIDKNKLKQWVGVSIIQDTGQSEYTYKMADLLPKHDYKIRIRACNDKYGCSVETGYFVTKGPPDHPKDLIISNITNSTVEIGWKPGYNGGVSQHFAIEKYERKQWIGVITVQETGNPYYTYKMTDLSQTQTYKIRIRACNEKYGCSVRTGSFITKGPPDRPKDFIISNITKSTVTIGWTPGYSWGISQHFIIDKSESKQWVRVVFIQDTGEPYYTYEMTNLLPKRNYQIRIQACNDNYGCSVETGSFITKSESKVETQSSFVPKNIIIVISVCVFVFLLIAITIVVVKCIMRKKQSNSRFKNVQYSSNIAQASDKKPVAL